MHDMGLSVLRIGVAVYIGMSLLVLLRQSRYVYYPDRHVDMTPDMLGMAFEDIKLKAEDGETIGAWFVPAPAEKNMGLTVLFSHGNAGDIGDRVGSVKTFHDMGMSVLIYDYRGYGTSSGRPTEVGTYLDVMAAWRHLVDDRQVPKERIVLFGRSLGGSVAAWLAVREEPAALVIESAFTSAKDMASRLFPYLPIRLLCRFKYNTVAAVKDVKCPVLVAHGRQDTTIPFKHGERIYEAANQPKLFVEMIGDHNDGGMDIDKSYQQALSDFLKNARPPD